MGHTSNFKSLGPPDALTCLDRINSAIVEDSDLEAMLPRVLDVLLDEFQCDRAWFMYPCDPETDSIIIHCERTKPDWPGLASAGGVLPASAPTKAFLLKCQNSNGPIRFDPEHDPIEAQGHDAFDQFGVKSQLSLPLEPSNGPNWVLAIQHCSEAVVYDRVVPLFHSVGKRIASGLTTALTLQDLRQSEERFRAMVDHATEAILISDLDSGVFTDANPMAARFFGTSVENLINNYGPTDLSPEFQPDGQLSSQKAIGYIKEALDGDFPTFEWTHKTVDGDLVPTEISLGRFPDKTRRLVRGTITDITSRKNDLKLRIELERQLAQTQKLETIGHLTGGVAHDFNNLLSVILGNLELLLLDTDQTPSGKDYIQNSITATNKGADLIRNMLSFARKAPLSPSMLNLNEVTASIKDWGGRTIPATIDIRMFLAEDLWPVMADPVSTDSSILNLIINARDAMNERGTITIETCNKTVHEPADNQGVNDLEPGNYVMLAISDTGNGIPQDQINRLVEPFYTTKPAGQGSGLGLSMVHGFMKQSSGSVHVYSEVGVGTTVKLFFPAFSEEPTSMPIPIPERPELDQPSIRILVAEDQPEVMNVVVRILQKAGHNVVEAATGDIALELFHSNGPFDLLLTDIVMPGRLQGPDLARELRALDPSLPVAFMTGYAREATLHGNGLREEDIRLMKPVSRSDLLDAVKTAVGSTT